jgi:NDP-sugar pyrophosphorylase family protein
MDAVILAAGRGERLRPHTDKTAKCLLPIRHRPLIEWILKELPLTIDRMVLVIHTSAQQIQKKITDPRVIFIDQPELLGTFSALRAAQPVIQSPSFLVLFGDNLYDPGDLQLLSRVQPWAMGVLAQIGSGSHLIIEQEWVKGIDAQPPRSADRNVCVGAFHLDARIFSIPPISIPGTRHQEIGLPQTMVGAGIPIRAVSMTRWQPVGTLEEYAQAQHWR